MTFSANGLKILVVEDNIGDYILIEEYILDEVEQSDITNAKSFAEAKEYLARNSYDSILLDLSLPDASGKELIHEMLQIANKTPVIVLTGYSDKAFSISTLSLGIADYLLKDELTAAHLGKSIVHNIERKRINAERRKAEDEKEKLIFELTRNNENLRQFAFITSHNLRAPIANLLGLTNLMEDIKVENEELKEVIDLIKRSVYTFEDTIRDLNAILLIKGSAAMTLEEIDFAPIFERVKNQCGKLVTESEAKIYADFSKGPIVRFNKAYLESIILNLLTNAIKFRSLDRDLEIWIKTEEDDEDVILYFNDNGMGVDAVLQKNKLFKLYHRFHPHIEGRGLGLYLVKSQIDALGGSIEIDSQVEEGARFTLKFKK